MVDVNPNWGQRPEQIIEKPTSVTVFGVLNIVFGGLNLLCSPCMLFGLVFGGEHIEMTDGYRTWTLISYIISFGLSIWLITLGVGLLSLRKWARRGSVVYACVVIVLGIINVVVGFLALHFEWIIMQEAQMPGYIGGMCGGVIGLIYPVLLLIFMRTERVKRAFGE